ncbi:MAG: Crp/Fnr family transcriptional regulator [Flavobacteriales bacterium]|jgi:CRP/FNR family transcriptional regulator, anaerobic regulatory protein|nr:Crp/Fnr family transcriptional regulator [Flavobacteriales bacterium]
MREKLYDYYNVIFEKELIEEIIKFGTFKALKKGELLIDINQEITDIPLLLNGAIKIVRENAQGEELLLYFLERGDTCAISFNNCIRRKKSLVRGVVEKDCEVIFLPISKLDEWLSKYKTWREFVIDSYNIRLNEMIEAIDTLAFMNMDERLYKYLKDKVQIMRDTTLNTTHLEISQELNTSRVVISRLLKQLEKRGKIKLHRNQIDVLDF